MNTNSILSSINYVNGLVKESNQNEIDIFKHLCTISITESWKNDSFYEGAPHFLRYKSKKFSALMKEVFHRSTTWFRNMESILGILGGEELLLNHGRENMVSFRGYSKVEQEFVLRAAKKRPLASFHALLKASGLRGQHTPDIDKELVSIWKKKFNALLKRFENLKKKYVRVQDENKKLKAEVNKLNKIIARKG